MSTDIDMMIRDALAVDAERAPTLPEEWADWVGAESVVVRAMTGARRRRPLVTIAWLSAAAAAITVIAVIARPDPADAPTDSLPAPWTPPGTEFPLVDLGPATEVWDGPVVAGLTRAVGIDGHPDQIVTTSLQYYGNPTPVVTRCVWENGGGGCMPEWNDGGPTVGRTSSVDNREADFDLWTWDPLPTEVALVGFDDGTQQLWQRPIASAVWFPAHPGSGEPVMIGYAASGDEVLRWDETSQQAYADAVEAADWPVRYELSQPQQEELHQLMAGSMRTCLTDRGGTIGAGDVATFPDGVDDVAVWNECVPIVKQIVGDRVAQIDPPTGGA